MRLCDNWAIWKCDGCGMLTLVESVSDPEEFQKGELGEMYLEWATSFYPKEMIIQPKRFLGIPDKLNKIYAETVAAFNNELGILCAIGLRSIIEGLCDDKETSSKGDNLEKKITSLTKIGIPANIADNLHGFRFMGNTAVHELVAPEQKDLRLAIEIVEDLLNFVYALDYKTRHLRNAQKPRLKFVINEDTEESDQSQ